MGEQLMNNANVDSDIHEPFGVDNTELLLIISPSPVYRETLKDYLLDLEYRVVGPFDSVDRGYSFIRKMTPNLIIFDAINTQSELINFSQMLQRDAKNLPILVLYQEDSFAITHTKVKYISPPINPTELDKKIKQLLGKDSKSTGSKVDLILDFTNNFFHKLIHLAPPGAKTDLREIIDDLLTQFTLRNSNFSRREEEAISLKLSNEDQFDEQNYKVNFSLIIDEIIKLVDETLETNWGKALVEDVFEALIIEVSDFPQVVMEIVEEKGKDPKNIQESLQTAIPDTSNLPTTVFVANLTLSDTGPELEEIVSHDPSMIEEFDEVVSSQIMTLVGQGASYHEGIFGPIPIPKSDNIVAVIWSKLLKSNIEDKRMGGRTLAIIVIGMRREIINLIPPREELKSVFNPLEKVEHTDDITKTILYQIEERYEGYLK